MGVHIGPGVLGLTLLQQHIGDNLVELGDQLEHGVVGKVLHGELPLAGVARVGLPQDGVPVTRHHLERTGRYYSGKTSVTSIKYSLCVKTEGHNIRLSIISVPGRELQGAFLMDSLFLLQFLIFISIKLNRFLDLRINNCPTETSVLKKDFRTPTNDGCVRCVLPFQTSGCSRCSPSSSHQKLLHPAPSAARSATPAPPVSEK